MNTLENFLNCLSSREKIVYLYGFILIVICNLYIYLANKRIIRAAPGADKPSFLWRNSLMKAAQRPFIYAFLFLLLYFMVTVLLKRSCCAEEFRQGGQLLLLVLLIWALLSALK